MEGLELQPFYPNLQGELYKKVGVNSSTDAQKVGGDLLKSYLKAYATVLIAAAPIEEAVVGGLAAIGIKAEATFAKEAAIIKAEVSEVKEAIVAEKTVIKPTIKEQATTVKNTLNYGKNSVSVQTKNKTIHYDLEGATHKGVETPHKQYSYPNTNSKGETFMNKDRKTVEPMTEQDIRTVKKVLEKRKN